MADQPVAVLEVAVAEAGRKLKRIVIAILGGLVLVIGVIAIPYPGPGWLIVFMGLAILATEFSWAQRVLDFARGKYDAWEAWLGKQNIWIRMLFLLLTAAVVLLTLWLLNVFGMMRSLIGLDLPQVDSPIF